ncbi:glycosyl transferase family 1 [Cytobacillus firmus]|uniref:glycosyltransferase n=1 Tax=Cytobacillus firmus TaxID=1399 RepID=UPI00077CC6F4|nr:glycosyltransferase [Cytobacillus firmus]MBG9544700.1 glycosyl transferase family 1 [Cytobacillus firmus]MBG9554021.1 glycosyl transferase family 1 [Cytobacillus firmus]MBG9558448.1 glycosyl transferase family 1 [Cytobacillus firmus]MBG9577010.1 glycosyl transferase family 1 [Cytobacillus firmus]MEC1894335.1 glycosyltransferase [Cytobacillus firmus]
MKVLILAPSRSIHTHKWALFYKNKGIDVKVVTFSDHFSAENAKDIDTITLPKLLPGKLSYISSVFALKKVLKSFQPDILHAHYVSSYGFVGALANYKPFYVSVWGRDIFQFPQQGGVNRKIVEYTLSKADVICSTSHIMAKETNKYTDKKVYVTPFGVDMDKFRPMPEFKTEGKVTFGTVKALSDKYGIGDLIKAFARIYKEKSNSELLIVGDGPQRAEYEQLTRDLGIDHVTEFTGRVPNDKVPEYINKMDVFGVPSTEDSESFGVAAVESMACGVPAVVSNVGGLPEVVLEGKTGFVVPKENPEELAKAMLHLADNKEKSIEMGHAGIEHVKANYNWTDNANGMLDLYEQTLNKGMKS